MKHAFPAGPRKTDRVCRPTAPEVNTTRDQLVAAHLKLVESIAHSIGQRLPPSFERDDLIGTGNVALVRAAANYAPDEHGGAPFAVYARHVVRGAILESVRRRHYTEATRPPLEDVPASRLASRPAIDRQIDASRDRLRIIEALTWLSRDQRAVIVERYGDHAAKKKPSTPEVCWCGRCARHSGRHLGWPREAELHEEALAILRTRLRA